jgi:putative peptide zinc metalloprotease protein
VAYAVLSHAYRCVVLGGTLYIAFGYLKDHRLSAVGHFLALAVALSLFAWPAVRFFHGLRVRGRLPEMRPARVWLLLGAGAALLMFTFGVPLPVKVRGLGLIQVAPSHLRRVATPESGGFLEQVHVRDGQQVRAGEVLAVLTNPKLEIKLRVLEAERALRLQQQAAQVAQRADSPVADEEDVERWQRYHAEVQGLDSQCAQLRERAARLVLRAPCDGAVMALRPIDETGKWLDAGSLICSIGNTGALRTLVLVEPADRKLVAAGAAATVRVHGGGSRVTQGTVRLAAHMEAQNIPPQLSHHAGGEISTYQDPVSRAETPQRQHFLVTVDLADAGPEPTPGVLARVQIDAGAQTIWWRVKRYLAVTFNWGL